MNKRFLILGMCVLLAGVALGGGAPLEGGDNFNDNLRNRTLWRLSTSNTGRLLETGKRLCYDTQDAPYFRNASWLWKTQFWMFSGDTLEMSVLINFPDVAIGAGGQINLGMGLADGYLASSKKFDVLVQDNNSPRRIVLESYGGSLTPGARFYPLPRDVSRFYLVLRYDTLTGKVTVWQRAVDNSWAVKAAAANLHTWWELPAGTTPILVPFLYASSGEVPLSPADGLFFDNFHVIQTVP